MAQIQLKPMGREIAIEEIEKRRRSVEGAKLSYLWWIPLGKINASARKWHEVKGDVASILQLKKILEAMRREDLIFIKLGKEVGDGKNQ